MIIRLRPLDVASPIIMLDENEHGNRVRVSVQYAEGTIVADMLEGDFALDCIATINQSSAIVICGGRAVLFKLPGIVKIIECYPVLDLTSWKDTLILVHFNRLTVVNESEVIASPRLVTDELRVVNVTETLIDYVGVLDGEIVQGSYRYR